MTNLPYLPHQKGKNAERLACEFLQQKGLKLDAVNYSCRAGELDLIMQDANHLVFVEVRYRQTKTFGSSADSIDSYKRKKLLKTAKFYLQQHDLTEKVPSRFDVITIDANNKINWIQNAFQDEYNF